jgi:hypothetical protein
VGVRAGADFKLSCSSPYIHGLYGTGMSGLSK